MSKKLMTAAGYPVAHNKNVQTAGKKVLNFFKTCGFWNSSPTLIEK
ncbi:protein of unknown function, might be Catalase [Moritella yayanosii]|uniref:Uncharacterized protein n=1 Tax=Moritella yayanosii TaxID=69539 RepID=A0A330LJS4_9GAMM|nr:protein of unknown function, might be Catalase [Moritella yayanosii]